MEFRANNKRGIKSRGFSLIEMMVSVALFSIVMVVSTVALLSLIDATRKAQALQSVMNNLNIALDGMVRSVRMGSMYHCGATGDITTTRNCASGEAFDDAVFAFKPFCTNAPCNESGRWVYRYNSSQKRLEKSENNGTSWFSITAPEVEIDSMEFYVDGTTSGDYIQPKVVIVLRGTAGANNQKTQTTFNIQATAVQRLLDI